jgi:hypothetical protein
VPAEIEFSERPDCNHKDNEAELQRDIEQTSNDANLVQDLCNDSLVDAALVRHHDVSHVDQLVASHLLAFEMVGVFELLKLSGLFEIDVFGLSRLIFKVQNEVVVE